MSTTRAPVTETTAPSETARALDALAPWVEAGVLAPIDGHVAEAIARLTPEFDETVLLAAALAVRATRLGHVCIVLEDVAGSIIIEEAGSDLGALDWPDPRQWARRLRRSDAVTTIDAEPADPDPGPDRVTTDTICPLVFDGERVYLERYWRYERAVGDELLSRAAAGDGGATPAALDTALADALDAAFGAAGPTKPDQQRHAAAVALTGRLAVIAGGPGTGKTRTLARLLIAAFAVARANGETISVALCAPTGKAAARMNEALAAELARTDVPPEVAETLAGTTASTIHRLLGPTGSTAFRHDRANPLTADLVIVDETSMVSLPLMAKLLDAVRPDARLVLVGDPYQLASIEAGAVLGDVVGPAAGIDPTGRLRTGPLADAVVVLDRTHRFDADSPISRLADAVRGGDADAAVSALADGGPNLTWVRPDDLAALGSVEDLLAARALEVVAAAGRGDAAAGLAALRDTKVLAATRRGALGTDDWQARIERGLGSSTPRRDFYVGRPVIVTRNDYAHRLFNGDTGLAVADGDGLTVAFSADAAAGLVPAQLSSIETWWSMTIHKSQGSEFRHVVVSLPPSPSPILTRELLYTAITRAREALTIVADEDAIRSAIAKPVARASGLGARLWR